MLYFQDTTFSKKSRVEKVKKNPCSKIRNEETKYLCKNIGYDTQFRRRPPLETCSMKAEGRPGRAAHFFSILPPQIPISFIERPLLAEDLQVTHIAAAGGAVYYAPINCLVKFSVIMYTGVPFAAGGGAVY